VTAWRSHHGHARRNRLRAFWRSPQS